MFNVCPGCGEYSDDKVVDTTSSGACAICKVCNYRHPFRMLPLLIITGASCTGKTTLGLQLPDRVTNCVCLESDILWSDEFNKPGDDYKTYRNLWLRMAKNIGQSGRPVVLIGSSAPGQFEKCNESRYFSKINYLALVCNENTLVDRLKARPSWRKSGTAESIKNMVDFNNWLIGNANISNPPVSLLDTSDISVEETISSALHWIADCLEEEAVAY